MGTGALQLPELAIPLMTRQDSDYFHKLLYELEQKPAGEPRAHRLRAPAPGQDDLGSRDRGVSHAEPRDVADRGCLRLHLRERAPRDHGPEGVLAGREPVVHGI